MGTGKGSSESRGCEGWKQSGEGTGFPFSVAGQGPASLNQEMESSSGLFNGARVLHFLAGRPPIARVRDYSFGE